MHKTVLVEIGGSAAQIDEEIVPVVVALNKIGGLRTLDSCQHSSTVDGVELAHVFIRCDIGVFREALILNEINDIHNRDFPWFLMRVRMSWHPDGPKPHSIIEFDRRCVDEMAETIEKVAVVVSKYIV